MPVTTVTPSPGFARLCIIAILGILSANANRYNKMTWDSSGLVSGALSSRTSSELFLSQLDKQGKKWEKSVKLWLSDPACGKLRQTMAIDATLQITSLPLQDFNVTSLSLHIYLSELVVKFGQHYKLQTFPVHISTISIAFNSNLPLYWAGLSDTTG